MKICLVILGSLAGTSTGVPTHSKFVYDEGSGLIELENSQLRLNVKGGEIREPGANLVLWPCHPLNHEIFKFENGLIKLVVDTSLCLNVAGGVNAGAPINVWHCEQDGVRAAHEEFEIRLDGRINLKQMPNMCLNVKEGRIEHGAEVILWECSNDAFPANELFTLNSTNGYIQVKSNPDFHFNVQGELKPGSPIVLWSCQAGPHEAFEFTKDSRIRLKMAENLCLNGEGGVAAGHKIVAWPCGETPQYNELFKYDADRKVIYSQTEPELGFNAAGGAMKAGDDIVLWYLKDSDEL